MQSMPAWRIWSGVTKSGLPTPSEITSPIVAAISKNLRMPDGLIERTRLESISRLTTPAIGHPLLISGSGDAAEGKDTRWLPKRLARFAFDMIAHPPSPEWVTRVVIK